MQTRVLWAVCVLAALCAAQDVFSDVNNTVVNNARVFSGDTTNDLSFNTLAVVNGHVCQRASSHSHKGRSNGDEGGGCDRHMC